MPLKLSIRDIPTGGLTIDRVVKPEEIGLTPDDCPIKSNLTVKARAERGSNFVIVQAAVNAVTQEYCARCLAPIDLTHDKEFTFHFEVQSPNDVFDVGEEIRQEFVLDTVTRILCRPDCKGICSGCGANLNTEQCRCKST